jgi:hypothetical protein
MKKQAAVLMLAIGGLPFGAIAQAVRPSQLADCRKALDMIRSSAADRKDQRISAAMRIEQNSSCYAEILFLERMGSAEAQARAFTRFLQDYEARRNDKQAGAAKSTGGGTSVVSKGLAAEAISVAAEYGALTESVNKQVVTVQGSLGGFASALARQKLIEYCPSGVGQGPCLNRSGLNFLKRISYGVSFDTSGNAEAVAGTASGSPQGPAQPVTFTGSRHQISAWTGRMILWNIRDASSDAFKAKWAATLQAATAAASGPNVDAVKATGADLLKSFQTFVDGIKLGQSFDDVFKAAFPKFQAAQVADLDAVFDEWAEQVVKMIPDDAVQTNNVIDLLQARSAYLAAEDDLISALASQPVLTFEYNNNRPVAQEPTSSFRVVFDKGFGKWSFTANGAFTIYDTRPKIANATRLRDAQAGVQIQRDLGQLMGMPVALSTSYYFQYQNGPAILNVTPGTPLPGITFTGLPATATQVFAQTGNLHLGQMRLALAPGKSSMRIPLAVSYSNRTELISKPAWRAQIGISYDFDALTAK